MKKLFTLFTFCVFLIPCSVRATDYTIGSNDYDSNNTPLNTYNNYCLTQNLYLASELTAAGASAGNITAISFRVKSATSKERNIDVYITATNATQLTGFTDVSVGNKVYSGSSSKKITIPTSGWYTITLDNAFAWDGTSNILVTIDDNSNNWTSGQSSHYCLWSGASGKNRTAYYLHNSTNPNPTNISVSATLQKYYPTIKFTVVAPSPSVPATPSDLTVSSINTSSATLAWSAVANATSYDLQQSANGSDWSLLSSGETGTSYNWTGLDAESTQYARIRANNATGNSNWSDAVTVTTDAVFEYNDIEFDKWSKTALLPTSGNYYLNGDVAFGWESSPDITLTDDLNLCLNGHTADIFYRKFIVPSGKTLTIYDNVGGGKITGVVASEVGEFEDYVSSLIIVKSGGTLILKEGTIENNYVPDEDGSSYAIYSNGTLIMSGSPVIESKAVDIYLSAAGVITLDGAISNAEKYTVDKYAGSIVTSGWNTHMGSKRPSNYFEHVDDSKGFYLNEGEVNVIKALSLSESAANTSIASNQDRLVNVALTRSFSSSYCNTICLPFSLTHAQLQEIFGTGYKLWNFTGSSLDGEDIALGFSEVEALEAGKPYLIQPAENVVNPAFEAVTISAADPVDVKTDYVDFKGIYAPKHLTAGDHSILFLGANNRLFFASEDGYMNGFRAYFEVKGDARLAVRAHIVQRYNATTGIENPSLKNNSQKRIKNGQLLIEHNGVLYNAQGQIVQ